MQSTRQKWETQKTQRIFKQIATCNQTLIQTRDLEPEHDSSDILNFLAIMSLVILIKRNLIKKKRCNKILKCKKEYKITVYDNGTA